MESVPQVVGGGVAFLATLGAGQMVAGGLRLSCALPVVSTLAGGAVVCASAVASLEVASQGAFVQEALALALAQPPLEQGDALRAEKQAAFVVGAAAVFRALGGRYRSVLPSDVLHPGAHAHASVPATTAKATRPQKQAVARLGRRHGCHSCGRRRGVPGFCADHMPPTKFFRQRRSWLSTLLWPRWLQSALAMEPTQRLYPQCSTCSVAQSSAVRDFERQARFAAPSLRYHLGASSLRLYHATGAIISALYILTSLDDS